jgi:hypothetical protein
VLRSLTPLVGGHGGSMGQYQVSRTAKIGGPPALVYAAIADYRRQHPHIVPPEFFTRLEVLEGGVGAGTRTRVEMRIFGTSRVFEQVVTEPEPGRVLMESNLDGSGVSTFTVDKGDNAESAYVTIASAIVARPGIPGLLERTVLSIMLPRIYEKELARLAQCVAARRSTEGAARCVTGDAQTRDEYR